MAVERPAGSRWKSSVCTTEIVVVHSPSTDVSLSCGGSEMVPLSEEPASKGSLDPTLAEGTQLGKRYADEETGLEVLCTKQGSGTLTVDGYPLTLQGAKPLPASD